ncbi:MAG: diguanylate cyclase [Ilumatobacteraceae bacterium]
MTTRDVVHDGGAQRSFRAHLASSLPRGGVLSEHSFTTRHRGICVLLWAHVVALVLIMRIVQPTVSYPRADIGIVVVFAAVASLPRAGRTVRSSAATLGLLSSSAVLIHFFGGAIEAHFHFFVTIAVIALYQNWLPYLVGVGFVLLHHAVLGTLAPEAVYSHAAGVHHPARFALIHGGFIVAESIACLIYWRTTEDAIDAERTARRDLLFAHDDLASAQRLSGVGSWDWDLEDDTVTWSDQFYSLVGRERATFTPTLESYLEIIHSGDKDRIAAMFAAALATRSSFDQEFRVVRADGVVREVHSRGEWLVDPDGSPRRFLGTARDVTERNELQEAVRHMAFHDPLTGLANRRLFLDRLEHALTLVDRSGGHIAVLFIDLDGFKQINDTLGHQAGDDALREVATRLTIAARSADTVARFGGDEFAILCEGVDDEFGDAIATRIHDELALPFEVGGVSVTLQGSIGTTVATCGADAEDVLRAADAAMYVAKHAADRPASRLAAMAPPPR